MRNALIGHTGFVGGNLLGQAHFDDAYNSSNIGDINGKHYQLIVCAGAPGTKWKANQEPAADRASLELLTSSLEKVAAEHFILVSTIDVYPRPTRVDEDTRIDEPGSPYGEHRLRLEDFVRKRFEATVIRLPALFGSGLKKNVIYDLLHNHRVDKICPDSVLQFYPLVRAWQDIEVVRKNRVSLINFATEPISVKDIARETFGFELQNLDVENAARYDMRTKYANLFGKSGPYLYDRREIFAALAEYVEFASNRGLDPK